MKTLKNILSWVLMTGALAACEDGPTIDKATLGTYSGGAVYVSQEDGIFNIKWDEFWLNTTDGESVLFSDHFSYDVSVSSVDGTNGENSVYQIIKSIEVGQKCEITLNVGEIIAVLGQSATTEPIQFAVSLVDEQKKVYAVNYSSSMDVDATNINGIHYGYKMTNNWFVDGSSDPNAETQNDILRIDVGESYEQFQAQLCNILHNLGPNQKTGARFKLTFDVMWVSNDGRDSRTISIWTGKNPDFDYLHYEYRWTDDNTELLNSDGSIIHSVENIQVQNNKYTTVTFEGTIGEAGSEYIGIQINLGEKNYDFINGGTFYFKNMRVLLNDNVVLENFMESL